MNIIDAGYMNNKGEYIEDLMYFSFDEITEQEKQEVLKYEYENEQYDSAA